MLFTSITFLVYFLPLVLCATYVFRKNTRILNGILLLLSLMFYAWGEPVFVLLMVFSIIQNYSVGRCIGRFSNHKKLFLTIGLVLNLGLLFYFKYIAFFFANIAVLFNLSLDVPDVTLPLGISFFTFQAITYLVDLYRGQVGVQKNILNLALYISFFPQLIAGPIVRYGDIASQITKREITTEGFSEGVRRFMIGFAKKVLIANYFAAIADEIFAMPTSSLSTILVVIAIIAYTIQIYFDFSGYTDMAIGIGRMCGFTFPENFRYPYVARSVQEFWRRWHMTLSRFFRDYVYIPLGGNRQGKLATYRNLILVFVLCGMWHGAQWTFLIWGAYYGVFLVLERLFLSRVLEKIPAIFAWAYTIAIVMLGWLIFRADDMQHFTGMVKALSSDYYNPVYKKFAKNNLTIFMAVVAIFAATPIYHRYILTHKSRIVSVLSDVFLLACFLLAISNLAVGTYNPFIYFRF